jgi:transposase
MFTFSYKFIYLFKIRSPPKSPDLNPIEWVWSDMKRYVRKHFCNNETELANAVHAFQKKLTPSYCAKYINKLKEVCKLNLNILL